MALTIEDIPFAAIDGIELLARVYHDPENSIGRGVVSVHGGAWTKNDRTTASKLDSALAQSGLTVMALDFRQAPQFQFPAASRDVAAGIRYLRIHAERFGLDPDSIGLVGSSSGGHTALLAGLTPSAEHHLGTPIYSENGDLDSRDDVSAAVSYVVALWPVSDPLARYHYAREVGRDDLVASHEAYFGDEAHMRAASIPRLLGAREYDQLPPIWIAQPGADKNVPQAITFALLEALQNAGAEVEYSFFPGQPHAFLYEDTSASAHCLAQLVAYVHRQLETKDKES